MAQEFRLSAVTTLPEDEFERAAAVLACGKFKAGVLKLAEEHKLVAVVSHETVTPRERKAAASTPEVPPVADPAVLADVGAAVKTAEQMATDAEERQPTPLHTGRHGRGGAAA